MSNTSAIRAGETIVVRNVAGRDEPMMILNRCAHHSIGYYCEDHACHMANAGNLVIHLGDGGDHRIAIWCSVCRFYQAGDPAQVAALTQEALVW